MNLCQSSPVLAPLNDFAHSAVNPGTAMQRRAARSPFTSLFTARSQCHLVTF